MDEAVEEGREAAAVGVGAFGVGGVGAEDVELLFGAGEGDVEDVEFVDFGEQLFVAALWFEEGGVLGREGDEGCGELRAVGREEGGWHVDPEVGGVVGAVGEGADDDGFAEAFGFVDGEQLDGVDVFRRGGGEVVLFVEPLEELACVLAVACGEGGDAVEEGGCVEGVEALEVEEADDLLAAVVEVEGG